MHILHGFSKTLLEHQIEKGVVGIACNTYGTEEDGFVFLLLHFTHCSVVGLIGTNTPYFSFRTDGTPYSSFTCYTKWRYAWLIYWIIATFECIVQWTTNNITGNSTHNLRHKSHQSTAGCSHSIEVQTVTACMEAIPNNTWNVWMLQEMLLPFNFPPIVFFFITMSYIISYSSHQTWPTFWNISIIRL